MPGSSRSSKPIVKPGRCGPSRSLLRLSLESFVAFVALGVGAYLGYVAVIWVTLALSRSG